MLYMNSAKIDIRNVPKTADKIKSLHLKPIKGLIVILCMGFLLLFYGRPSLIIGIWLIIVSLFGLGLMPDRLLISYNKDYLILHDSHARDKCWLIDWSEIVSWHYVKHKTYDQLFVNLIDGSSHSADSFSKRKTARIMNEYAPGKEGRRSGIGKVKI